MTPETRLELIRAKGRGNTAPAYRPKGIFLAKNPDVPTSQKPRLPLRDLPERCKVGAFYMPIQGDLPIPHVWVKTPDPKPPEPVRPKRRRKGKHYLTEIAEKVSGKLAVISKSP